MIPMKLLSKYFVVLRKVKDALSDEEITMLTKLWKDCIALIDDFNWPLIKGVIVKEKTMLQGLKPIKKKGGCDAISAVNPQTE